MKNLATYRFDGVRFFSDLKENLSRSGDLIYARNHLYRGKFNGFWKCIHNTNKVLNVKHHHNVGCVNPGMCLTHKVNVSYGYFLHYRIGWKVRDECEDKKCVTYDPIILKYKPRLEKNMKNILAQIFP